MKRRKQRSKYRSLTLYVVFSIAMIILYSVVEMVTDTLTRISHDTLTTCFMSVFGGEILCACLIKIFKLKQDNVIDNSDPRYDEGSDEI